MKLNDVISALRDGAVLHLSLADKPTWKLNNGTTELTVDSRSVQTLINPRDHRRIRRQPAVVPSQIWRYAPSTEDVVL